MNRKLVAAIALAAGLLLSAAAEARVTFTIGDNVYADGQWFTQAEYEQYKKDHPSNGSPPPAAAQPAAPYQYQQQAQRSYYPLPAQPQAASTATLVDGKPVVTIAPPSVSAPLPIQGVAATAPALPPAAATSATYVAAAPALRAASCKTTRYYDEFPGDAERFDCGAIGKLTRQDMLAQGWRIDFIEKLPATAGQATPNAYKIILSR